MYKTREAGGRLKPGGEQFNKSFLPKDRSTRGVIQVCEMMQSLLSCGDSKLERLEFSPLPLICSEHLL